MARRGETRQCRAVLHSETDGDLRCQGLVSDVVTHQGDHWALVNGGHRIKWTESVAVYPPTPEERAEDPTMGAEVVREKLAAQGAGVANPNRARDTQVTGTYYQRAIQIWDIIQVWELDYFQGSALKYLLRAGNKGPKLEDLKKCRHVLDKLIEIEEGRG